MTTSGKTIFCNFSGLQLMTINYPLDLEVNKVISLESSPDSAPLLTEYLVIKKTIKVSVNGSIFFTYIIEPTGRSTEQKHFLI